MSVFLEHAARGRTAAWRYVATLVLASFIVFAAGVMLVFGLAIAGVSPDVLATEMAQPTRPTTFFATTGVSFGLVVVALVAAAWVIQHKRLGDLTGRWSWRMAAAAAGCWAVVLIGANLIDALIAPAGFRITASTATVGLALAALPALAVQTFAEELLFRGYLTQGLLLAFKRPVAAAVVSALLFGAAHIPNGAPQAVGAVAFGLATALIAIRTGGIAFTWGMHLVNNLVGAVVLVSADDVFRGSPALITQHTPQLMWWDTGVEVVGLLLVTTLVLRRPRPAAATPDR